MYHIFKESTVDGQVGLFYFLSIVFDAVVNTDLQVCGMMLTWRLGNSIPEYAPKYNDDSSSHKSLISLGLTRVITPLLPQSLTCDLCALLQNCC